MEDDWIPNKTHRRHTSRLSSVNLDSVPYSRSWNELQLIRVLSISGALVGVHRHASVVGVVALLVLLVVVGCFSMYVVLWVLRWLSPLSPLSLYHVGPFKGHPCTLHYRLVGIMVNLFRWSLSAPPVLHLKKIITMLMTFSLNGACSFFVRRVQGFKSRDMTFSGNFL